MYNCKIEIHIIVKMDHIIVGVWCLVLCPCHVHVTWKTGIPRTVVIIRHNCWCVVFSFMPVSRACDLENWQFRDTVVIIRCAQHGLRERERESNYVSIIV